MTKLGLGMARTSEDAVRAAVDLGIEGYDTAVNYGSDHLVKLLPPDAFVISKVGYWPEPHACELSDSAYHCLNPDCLYDEIDRARDRMGRDADIWLLHNPEEALAMGLRRSLWRQRVHACLDAIEDQTYDSQDVGAAIWNAAIHPKSSPVHVEQWPVAWVEAPWESGFKHDFDSIASAPVKRGQVEYEDAFYCQMVQGYGWTVPGTAKPSRVKAYKEAFDRARARYISWM